MPPAMAPTIAAAAVPTVPIRLLINGSASGGVAAWMSTVSKIGTRKATFFSVQPTQGAPIPIGQTSGTSLK